MASAWESIMDFYNESMALADPRAMDFPFLDSQLLNNINILLYLFIVTYAGPKFMRHRRPYDLRHVITVYNFSMVALSTATFCMLMAGGWGTGYGLVCQDCDYSRSPQAMTMIKGCYMFWISKHIEFLDTYFFILRKKNNQASFLHIYHHSFMAYIWWWGMKFSPGGFGTFHALLNSFVHVVMYVYYGFSSLGPKYQKYLWWKKYLTAFQMVQFLAITTHMGNAMFLNNCKITKALGYILFFFPISFFVLFANFWIKNYRQKKLHHLDQNGNAVKHNKATQNGKSNGSLKQE